MRFATTYLIGLVFGVGIAISGMMNPAKVLNFFDVAGMWDASLAFVMGGALVVTFAGYRLVLRRAAPICEDRFALPTATRIDMRLIGGSAVFGVGWGLSGFCPGAVLPAIGTGLTPVFLFVAAMLAGMFAARGIDHLAARRQSGQTQLERSAK